MTTFKKPVNANTSVVDMNSFLKDKPVSPLDLNPALPAEFEHITGKALEKKREARYQTAAALRDDLRELKRETDTGLRSSGIRKSGLLPRLPSSTFQGTSRRTNYVLLGIVGVLVVALVASTAAVIRLRRVRPAFAGTTIAVLPFQNVGADKSVDYLAFGLADQIATLLTHIPSVEVRPLEMTQKYSSADLQQAGA